MNGILSSHQPQFRPEMLGRSLRAPKLETTYWGGGHPKEGTGTDYFCKVIRGEEPTKNFVAQNERAIAILDGYPVGKGHTLIIPKRHISNPFDASQTEWLAFFDILKRCKANLEAALKAHQQPLPDGYNIGINVDEAGGQSIPHLHIHLIPRYQGDMENPRGGVRGVIPSKQNYSGPPDLTVDELLTPPVV